MQKVAFMSLKWLGRTAATAAVVFTVERAVEGLGSLVKDAYRWATKKAPQGDTKKEPAKAAA